jgi:predicted metal-dependent peptidase
VDITLSEAFTFFLSARQRNFYARIISALIRQEAPGYGTVGVGISKDGRFVFYYDPAFIATLSLPKFLLILEHEVYHLVLGHIPRFLDLMSALQSEEEKRRFRAVMNVACDCAGNELMRSEKDFDKIYGQWFYQSETNPHGFLIPEKFHMERNQPFEIYQFTMLGQLQKATQDLGDVGEMTTYSVPIDPDADGQPEPQEGEDEAQGSGGSPEDGQDEEQPGEGQGDGQGQGEGEDEQDGSSGGQGDQEGDQGQQPGQGSGQGQGQPQPGQGGGQGQSQEQGPVAVLERYFNGQTGGAHGFWEEHLKDKNPDELQGLAERLRHEAKSFIRKAVHDHVKSRGTIPAGMKELIEKFLATPTIPWPQLLRSVCVRTRQTKVSRGMARPSRRMHGIHGVLPFPGRARDNRFTIWYALDTSGSMSTDDLIMGLAEVLNLVRTESDVTVVVMYCDAHLHVMYDVESTDDVDFNVVGRGGTDFNPPFIKLREMMHTDKAPDVLIYATDGYAPAPAPENRVPIPVIWLITPDGVEPSPDYGIHIRMEPF